MPTSLFPFFVDKFWLALVSFDNQLIFWSPSIFLLLCLTSTMARIDPRNRSSRRIGVPPLVHATPRLTDTPKQLYHSTHRPRSGLVYVSNKVTLIQDPTTVSNFYSPLNAPGVNLLRSDSAPSFLGTTNGTTFSSIGVHDPPTSRLVANGCAVDREVIPSLLVVSKTL